MSDQTPKGISIQERVRWHMNRDQTTIKDAENFRRKWGEYPNGYYAWQMVKQPKLKLPVTKSSEIKKPDRIMSAKSEFFKGRAVWKFELGCWLCKSADDCLAFLLKKDVPAAKLELLRRGFEWEWI